MLRLLLLLLTTGLLASKLFATTWTVGPGQTYTAPSQVAGFVGNGDTVDILAGTYPSDVTNWTADNLLIRGVGGMAHMESNGMAWGGKAIWVIQGENTTVEYIEFSECSVPDMNGAGIRQEGKNLTVRHCYFHDNENGILANNYMGSNIRIEFCEFAYNGFGDGQSHNLYINKIDTLFYRYNYSHHAHIGHELKSRADANFIEYNRFSNEASGDASREIDLPFGGQAFIIGNVIHQGPQGTNGNMIGYGLEGLTFSNLPLELHLIGNTMIDERSTGNFIHMPAGVQTIKAFGNAFVQNSGVWLQGTLPSTVDTLGNIFASSTAQLDMVDPSNYDFRPNMNSPLRSSGVPGGYSNSGYALVAWYEYVHPIDSTIRCQHATLDCGAHEYCTVVTGIGNIGEGVVLPYPNPCNNRLTIIRMPEDDWMQLKIIDASGRFLSAQTHSSLTSHTIDTSSLPNGRYQVHISGENGTRVASFVVLH